MIKVAIHRIQSIPTPGRVVQGSSIIAYNILSFLVFNNK